MFICILIAMANRSHSSTETDTAFIDTLADAHGKMERTNIKVCPSQNAIKKIINFCITHSLPYNDFLEGPHCTIAFSKEILTPISMIEQPKFKRVLVRNAYIDVFDTSDDGRVLVVRFDSGVLRQANDFYRKEYRLASKYAYSPHITLQKNLQEEMAIPLKLNFNFILNRVVMDNCK